MVRDTGEVQKSFFQPFGEFAQEGGGLTPYLFTDQEHDPESGLQYFGARYYDPWVGRFLEQDPELIGAHEGATFAAITRDAQQLNSYSYVTNRPTILVDPAGRQSVLESVNTRAIKEKVADGDIGGAFDEIVKQAENATGVIQTGGDVVGNETIPVPSAGDVVETVGAAEAAGVGKQGDVGKQATGDSNAAREGIYEFPDQKSSGKDYVGQSGDMDARLKTHEQSGRLEPGTETRTPVEGGKTAREVAEHKRIQEKTGGVPARESDAVSNQRDPIGARRKHLLDE